MSSETKAQEVILLNYKREAGTDLFTGSVSGGGAKFHFSAAPFAKMFELVGEALRNAPDFRLVIKRDEVATPCTLPPSMEDLLRTNTPAAIEALTVPPQRVVVGERHKPRPIVRPLRQGHDTLADAIGDCLYIKSKVNTFADNWLQVEDPVGGRWVPVEEREGLLYCGKLPVQVILNIESKWAKVQTAHVLALGLPRYYFPRRWNPTGGWITHEALASLYDQYQKEKANVPSK